jgi:hypothetical protein
LFTIQQLEFEARNGMNPALLTVRIQTQERIFNEHFFATQ